MNAKTIVEQLRQQYNLEQNYEIAFIMGSGLDGGVPEFEDKLEIPYTQTQMPKSKVHGFSGKFVFGKLFGKNVMKITRYHYYESGDLTLVRLPFEILAEFGVQTVIMATATGGVDPTFDVGTLMLIEDHINLTGNNPLIATTKIEFVDLNNAYDPCLRAQAIEAAQKAGVDLKVGTHIQFSGPTYETPAEVRMARVLGARTVSMSTAFDTICARANNIKVLAFASVVNKAGVPEEEITHEMVLQASAANAVKIKKILQQLLQK
jgi:purine-nucleoside phosphorylase